MIKSAIAYIRPVLSYSDPSNAKFSLAQLQWSLENYRKYFGLTILDEDTYIEEMLDNDTPLHQRPVLQQVLHLLESPENNKGLLVCSLSNLCPVRREQDTLLKQILAKGFTFYSGNENIDTSKPESQQAVRRRFSAGIY